MKLFLIVNEDRFFLSHRQPLAVEALKKGYNVTVVANNTGRKSEVTALGVHYIDFPVNPTGKKLMQELRTLWFLIRLFIKEKPDVVHNVGLKDMLWGGLAAKLVGVKVVINAVSGLGVMFSSPKLGLTAKVVLGVQRFSNNRKNVFEIFQNNEDKALYLKHRVMKEEQCVFIKGSGVDLNEYHYVEEPTTGKVIVLFTARMVKEKGVCDLVEAAEMLREKYENRVEFHLCGGLSANPKAIKEQELRSLCDDKYIHWFGFCRDVDERLRKCHIVAFPSYYREGVPKSLIEAAATGRPIITCNSIGCKDVVDDGVNGFLVPPKDTRALAERLETLINDAKLRQLMGKAGRLKAEREFDIHHVVEEHMKLYAKGESEQYEVKKQYGSINEDTTHPLEGVVAN